MSSDLYTDEDIEEEMYKDEVEYRKRMGIKTKPPHPLKYGKVMELEDIGAEAVRYYEEKRRRKKTQVFNEKIKFAKAMWKRGSFKIYSYKRPSSELSIFAVKGGEHPLIKIPMSNYDWKSLMYALAVMKGYKIKKAKTKGKEYGFWIYVGKK